MDIHVALHNVCELHTAAVDTPDFVFIGENVGEKVTRSDGSVFTIITTQPENDSETTLYRIITRDSDALSGKNYAGDELMPDHVVVRRLIDWLNERPAEPVETVLPPFFTDLAGEFPVHRMLVKKTHAIATLNCGAAVVFYRTDPKYIIDEHHRLTYRGFFTLREYIGTYRTHVPPLPGYVGSRKNEVVKLLREQQQAVGRLQRTWSAWH